MRTVSIFLQHPAAATLLIFRTGRSAVAHATVVPVTVTFQNGGNNVTWTGHGLGANEPVGFFVAA